MEFSLCHRMPERSFFYKGIQFPVCARCTGISLGFIIAPLFAFDLIYISLLWSFLLTTPALIDGLSQHFLKRESNNVLRVLTGILTGAGLISVAALTGRFISSLILKAII